METISFMHEQFINKAVNLEMEYGLRSFLGQNVSFEQGFGSNSGGMTVMTAELRIVKRNGNIVIKKGTRLTILEKP